MNTKPGLSWMMFCWLLFVLSIPPTVAYGQSLSQEQLKAMSSEALIQTWGNASSADRQLVEGAILEKRSSSLPALREAVVAGPPKVKMFTAALLAEMRDKGSVSALLATTYDSNEQVRTRAVTALRVIGDSQALPRLRELVRTTQKGSVLKVSLAALGKLGSPQDLPLIRPLLLHSDENVRVMAAGALAMLGSSEGQNILLAATQSKDPLAQKNATFALGYLNTAEAQKRLHEIIDDPTGQWKSYAVIALVQQELAGKSLQEQVKHLGQLVQQRDRIVADWTVEQLTDLNTPEAARALQDIAKKGGKIAEKAQRSLKAVEGR